MYNLSLSVHAYYMCTTALTIAEVHGYGVQDMAINLYSESKINFIIDTWQQATIDESGETTIPIHPLVATVTWKVASSSFTHHSNKYLQLFVQEFGFLQEP